MSSLSWCLDTQIKVVIFKPEHSFALSVQTDLSCAIPGPWGQPSYPGEHHEPSFSEMFAFSACDMHLCFAFLSSLVAERSGRSSSGRARVHGCAPGCSPRALVHPADPAAHGGGETPACCSPAAQPSPAALPKQNSPSLALRFRAVD